MQFSWRAGVGWLCAALLFVAGCGDSDDGDSSSAAASAGETVESSGDTADEDDVDATADDVESPPDTGVPPNTGVAGTFVTPFDDAPAAAVEGVELSGDLLFSELRNQLDAQEASTGSTEGSENADGAIEANLVSSVLSELVVSELVTQELAELGLSVGDDDLESVRSQVGEAPEGVDEAFIDNFIQRQAQYEVLGADLVGDEIDASGLECSRHVLVETEEDALAVIERLEGGEDFGEVAADASIDPSAAQNGGSLGCDISSFVPAFAEGVEVLEPGERSDPVQTDFGFHVIEKIAPGEEELELAGQDARQNALREWILVRVEDAEVDIDERIGTWDPVSGVVAIGTPDPDAPQILDESLVEDAGDN